MSSVRKSSAYPDTVQPGIPRLPDAPPVGWRRTTFGRHLYEEKRPVKMEDEREYDLVTVKRARGGVVKRETKLGRDISVKTQFEVKAGDFLISKRQIVHGACGVVPANLNGSTVSNEYAVLRGKDSIDLEFLKHFSHSVFFQQTCFHSSIGVHIEKMIFKTDKWFDWEFDLPPIDEQRRIAETLTIWDRAIETTERLIANSRSQKRALMSDLYSLKGKPNGSQTFKLGDLCDCYSGGTPSRRNAAYFNGTIPWLKSGELNRGVIAFADEAITEEALSRSSAKMVKSGTILLALYGATAGVVATTNIDAAINQAILAIIPNESLDKVYLQFYLEFQIDEMKRLTQGGQPNLSATIVKNLNIPVPDKTEQKSISDCILTADRLVRSQEEHLDNLRKQKVALVQQLLTGKRRVKIEEAAA